ncbi:hypothetical protein FJD34_26920 [Pseudomonas brenneri]|uniref:Uncharacterized protein n=1 Tax=Pseudomonas brenneri TaxID=129817 RepID=A0A5B2UHZ2_9PSED|nr:hypothetical protein F1720_27830 [Pseudomonas brenneri]TWR73594.1 hypothetical protein FJD34_26920 [Pseudomonas brenneri]
MTGPLAHDDLHWFSVIHRKQQHPPPVGASLLAKAVNDNAGIQAVRGDVGFFASKLAPTGE